MKKNEKILVMSPRVSRILYLSLVGVAFVLYITLRSNMTGPVLGMALLFDPFNPKVPLGERPRWQQLVLVIHVLTVLVLIFWPALSN